MEQEFREWGYNEHDESKLQECEEMIEQFAIDNPRTFTDLGIDPKSPLDNGPNHCFHIEHYDGPNVHLINGAMPKETSDQWYTANGRDYRVSHYLYQGVESTLS